MSCLVLYFFWILSYITYIRKHFCILPSPCQLCQEGTAAGAFTLLLALVSRAFRSLSPKLADGQDHTKFTDNTRGILRSRIVELKASNSTFRSTEWNIDFSRLVEVNLETISTFPSSIYAHPRHSGQDRWKGNSGIHAELNIWNSIPVNEVWLRKIISPYTKLTASEVIN